MQLSSSAHYMYIAVFAAALIAHARRRKHWQHCTRVSLPCFHQYRKFVHRIRGTNPTDEFSLCVCVSDVTAYVLILLLADMCLDAT